MAQLTMCRLPVEVGNANEMAWSVGREAQFMARTDAPATRVEAWKPQPWDSR